MRVVKQEMEQVKAEAITWVSHIQSKARDSLAWLEAQAKDLAQAQKFFRDDYIRECKELDKKTAELEEKSKQLKKEREKFEKESAGRKDDEDEEPPAADPDNEKMDEDEMDESEDKVCLSCVPLS